MRVGLSKSCMTPNRIYVLASALKARRSAVKIFFSVSTMARSSFSRPITGRAQGPPKRSREDARQERGEPQELKEIATYSPVYDTGVEFAAGRSGDRDRLTTAYQRHRLVGLGLKAHQARRERQEKRHDQ